MTMSIILKKIFLVCIIVLALLWVGCLQKTPQIHYVLPNGFCGAFIIYTERPNGMRMEASGARYTYVIPETGVLELQGKGPFYGWHTTSASFEDGTVIPAGTEKLPEDVVAFWGGGSQSGGMLYDFVGTKAEFRVFKKETATAEVKPGGCKKQ